MKNKVIHEFSRQINKFKQWVDCDLDYFIVYGNKTDGQIYCDFKDLIQITKEILKILNIDNAYVVNDILYVMAIDNETEDIMHYIIEYCNEKQLDIIVSNGYKHYLSSVRWQIAVIIGERNLIKYNNYLKLLQNDKNAYVRKRASYIILH